MTKIEYAMYAEDDALRELRVQANQAQQAAGRRLTADEIAVAMHCTARPHFARALMDAEVTFLI